MRTSARAVGNTQNFPVDSSWTCVGNPVSPPLIEVLAIRGELSDIGQDCRLRDIYAEE
jgi:hypothetical protein